MRYSIIALLCAACGSTANDYSGSQTPPDTSSHAPSPIEQFPGTIVQVPTPTLCATGTYYVEFQPTAHSLELGKCSPYTVPQDYAIAMADTFHLLNCDVFLTAGDDKSCSFVSYGCVPKYDGETFVWNGNVSFVEDRTAYETIVDGNPTWTYYVGIIGKSTLMIGECTFDVLIVPATP